MLLSARESDTLPVHLVVLWGCFIEESKLFIQSSVTRVDSLKCKNFFPWLSVIFGTVPWFLERRSVEYCWVCCCTHGGAPAPVSCKAENPGSKIQDRQARIGLKHFSSSVFHLDAVSELNQAVLHSVHFFSTSLPCPFEVTHCSTLLSLEIMGRTRLLLPLCGWGCQREVGRCQNNPWLSLQSPPFVQSCGQLAAGLPFSLDIINLPIFN